MKNVLLSIVLSLCLGATAVGQDPVDLKPEVLSGSFKAGLVANVGEISLGVRSYVDENGERQADISAIVNIVNDEGERVVQVRFNNEQLRALIAPAVLASVSQEIVRVSTGVASTLVAPERAKKIAKLKEIIAKEAK